MRRETAVDTIDAIGVGVGVAHSACIGPALAEAYPFDSGPAICSVRSRAALKAAPIRSTERWGADARWRSFSKNFPMRRAALCFFRHDGGRTGLFVPDAAEDALWP